MSNIEIDYTEKERLVSVQVQIPLYGNEQHVEKMRARLDGLIGLHFQDATITDIDQTPVDG